MAAPSAPSAAAIGRTAPPDAFCGAAPAIVSACEKAPPASAAEGITSATTKAATAHRNTGSASQVGWTYVQRASNGLWHGR